MTRYVAFLRGINVGGHAPVRMEKLCQLFETVGMSGVSTFRASGNVLFTSPKGTAGALRKNLETAVSAQLGTTVRVILRGTKELQEMAGAEPFQGAPSGKDAQYVTFLGARPTNTIPVPFRSPAGTVDVVGLRPREVFTLCRTVGNKVGFPNEFLERTLGVPATTRNWKTILGILEKEGVLRAHVDPAEGPSS
jgi:uncharacterized protein (DUF1697 family)